MDSDNTRKKWDDRYRDTPGTASSVAEVLKGNQHLLPSSGAALDLACGLGASALFLAKRGLDVHAWDISAVAIDKLNTCAQQKGITVHAQVRDCVSHPPETNAFDVIVVSRFLERELCPAIATALKPGGLLFYQTYACDSNRAEGPSNPHFLLAKGELLELFSSLELIVYQEGSEALFIGRRRAAGL